MEVADLSFEEAKLRISDQLKKFKELDDMRRKLNEQLFILDLQQEVSIKRYKKYLQMIGEHQQQENNRYISSQNLDESVAYRSVDSFLKSISKEIPIVCSQKVENEKIITAWEKLEHYRSFINQKKEVYFNLSKQDELIKNIAKMLKQQEKSKNETMDHPSDSEIQNVDYSQQLESIITKINDQEAQKEQLQTTREGLFREVTSMSKIEKEMQEQMIILQEQARILVQKRKWHPNSNDMDSSRNTNFTVFNSSFSIP